MERSERGLAVRILEAALGRRNSVDVQRMRDLADKKGVGWRSMQRARKKLGLAAVWDGTRWSWARRG